MTASAHHVDRIRGEAAMAATTVDTAPIETSSYGSSSGIFLSLAAKCSMPLSAAGCSRPSQQPSTFARNSLKIRTEAVSTSHHQIRLERPR
jgi:hypothetical protein